MRLTGLLQEPIPDMTEETAVIVQELNTGSCVDETR